MLKHDSLSPKGNRPFLGIFVTPDERLAFFHHILGPRTECAGFDGVICRTTRKSYSIRTAASFCLMVGLDPGKSSIQAATWNGRTVVSSRPCVPHHSKNCQHARA